VPSEPPLLLLLLLLLLLDSELLLLLLQVPSVPQILQLPAQLLVVS
jgi:hypothetical protein